MSKRGHKVRLNASTALLNQIVSTICGMLIPWSMITAFGSEAYGITISVAQFLSYIALIEGGMGRVARAELYKPLAENEVHAISGVYCAIKRFFRKIGLIFLLYAVFIAVFFYDIADVVGFTREYIFWIVLTIGLGRFAEYMGGITNITLLNADQRQYIVNIVTLTTNILNVVLIVATVNLGLDILWVKLISSTVFVARPIIYTIYVKRHYSFLPKKSEHVGLKNKWTGIGQHIAYYLQINADVFILTLLADVKIVAVYSVYHLVLYSLKTVTLSLTGGMEALFGNIIALEENDELIRTFERYKFILTAVVLILFGTAGGMILSFVKIYTAQVTDANYIQPVFAIILMLAEAVNCLVWPCSTICISANKLKETRWGAYLEAAINLVVSIILVFWNPLVGVALGSLISVLYKSIFYMNYTAKKILYTSFKHMVFRLFGTVILLTGCSSVGMLLINHVKITNYFQWAIVSSMLVIVLAIITVIACAIMYPKHLKELLHWILRKFKKT